MRTGLTTKYLLDKRKKILEELDSDAHYLATETFYYGEMDPLDILEVPCDSCQGIAKTVPTITTPCKYTVRCIQCGKSIAEPQKKAWKAWLMWSCINLGSMDYRELPFFGLAKLASPAARKRMVGIRKDLELRREIAGLNSELNPRFGLSRPSKKYLHHLEAYLCWATLALKLIKNHNKKNHNEK